MLEIHIPLDELLGFRGSLAGALMNACWVLFFVSIMLSVLVSVPASIGSTLVHRYFQPTLDWPMFHYALDDTTATNRAQGGS